MGTEPYGSTELPPGVIARLAGVDPAITPELIRESWELLTPFHAAAGYSAPKVHRDLAYGPDERNRLDVHAPDSPAGPAPVVVFVHGGGFVTGDKHTEGTPRFDLFGAWAVRNGYVGVTMTYRLAPDHTWPSGAEDVAAAAGWIAASIGSYGGDPDKIVIAGNSAGAVHLAGYVAGHAGTAPRIAGAVLMSGIYRQRVPSPDDPYHVYFGASPGPETAALPGLLASDVPLLFAVAQNDPPAFQAEAAAVVAAWADSRGTVPPMVWIEGHNHVSTIGSLTVDESAFGVPLRRFVNRVTGNGVPGGAG